MILALVMPCCLAAPARAQTVTGQGSLPAPQFAPGLVLRYQLDIRSTHDVSVSGVAENPQGGTQLAVRFAATLKLEALSPASGPPQLRATVEGVSVAISGDTFDPSLAAIERRYQQLEGYSTTLDPSLPRRTAPDSTDARAAVEYWLQALVSQIGAGPPGAPSSGAATEQPIPSAPLKGMVLRLESSYLRDEPCGGGRERAATTAASLANEACALILTRSTLAQTGSPRDQTPPGYRERGLRSSGRWEGAGESLAYIARRTGWVISITESQSEQMDFTITRDGGEVVRRQRGRIQTETNLLLQEVRTQN